jgi:hypothetical protein
MSSENDSTIAYLHWHAAEAAERGARLTAAGYAVLVLSSADGPQMQQLRAQVPAAILIDLGRLPSHGREVAFALRASKSLRSVPLLFFEGDADKTARLREELPDAAFVSWKSWKRALRAALAAPRAAAPVVPRSTSGYSGTPLWTKLGAKPARTLLVVGAPAGFEAQLAALPEGVVLLKRAEALFDLGLCFCASRAELERQWKKLAPKLADGGALWIAWPKQTSGVATDLNGDAVRAFGLEQGLVDTKVCAIDATWSGLRFQRRRIRGASADVR